MLFYIDVMIEALSYARCETDCACLAFNAKRAAEIEHQDAAAQGKIIGRCSAARKNGFLFLLPRSSLPRLSFFRLMSKLITARLPRVGFDNDLGGALLLAVAYYLGAEAAFFVGTLSDNIFAPFWPPNVILLCALLFSPIRRWWLFVLAAFPAHVLAESLVGMAIPAILVAFATNCLVAVGNAAGLRLLLGDSGWFRSPRHISVYALITFALCPGLVALGGAFVPILSGGAAEGYWQYWSQWYASNALGAATLGPFAITLMEVRPAPARSSVLLRLEIAAIAVGLVATSLIAFQDSFAPTITRYLPTLLYLPLSLILWTTVRFGVTGASGSILLVGATLLWRALKGGTLFNVGDAEANVFALQLFLVTLSIPILLLGAAIDGMGRAERETRESEERMAFAAASANVGLWSYKFLDKSFWATEHAGSILGLPPGRRLTLAVFYRAVDSSDRDFAERRLRQAIEERTPLEFEFRATGRSGEMRWINVRARPHFDTQENAVEMTGTLTDVTPSKAAEQEVKTQQQEITHLMRVSMLGEMAGGLAHELTQPLTSILANAQAGRMLLAREPIDIDELGRILDDIITEDARAGQVIHQLRAMLKKGEIRREFIDMNALIESTLALLHHEFVQRRIRIERQFANHLPAVFGDFVQLQQVLLNLLLNGLDALEGVSTSRRMITITTQTAHSNHELEVRIRDRGIGLPAGRADDVFKPFFTTKTRGLGLGLSICRSIIGTHGGELRLESNSTEGVTARFRLLSESGIAEPNLRSKDHGATGPADGICRR